MLSTSTKLRDASKNMLNWWTKNIQLNLFSLLLMNETNKWTQLFVCSFLFYWLWSHELHQQQRHHHPHTHFCTFCSCNLFSMFGCSRASFAIVFKSLLLCTKMSTTLENESRNTCAHFASSLFFINILSTRQSHTHFDRSFSRFTHKQSVG